MSKIYIIILNYNGWENTIECLESVIKNDYLNYQLIVVDNNSSNNSMQNIIEWAEGKREVSYSNNSSLIYLSQPSEIKPLKYIIYNKDDILNKKYSKKEKAFKNSIVFIQSSNNGGFAAGNNLGIKYALNKDDFESIWLLNSDTVIKRNSLSSLIEYANSKDVGICGSKLIYYHTPEVIQSLGGHINKFFGTTSHILKEENISDKLDYIIGASFLINKKVIDNIGLLPEEYFLYFEETDYCLNAKNKGFTLDLDLKSIVYHKEGATTKDTLTNTDGEFIELLKLRNRIIFHKKYLSGGVGLYLGFIIVLINRIRRGQFSRIGKIIKLLY